MTSTLCDNVLIIGAGLIGGSLARALRERQLVSCVSGYGRNSEPLRQAVADGTLDAVADDLPVAIAAADVIILGVPTLTVKDYLPLVMQHRKPSCVVSDVASVKGEITAMLLEAFGEVPAWFVPGHPIAGSEKSGIAAANANLYEHHKVILTPDDTTDADALALIDRLWRSVGADVVHMPVEEHDKVLAATSHLPHALAFVLVDTLNDMQQKNRIFEFAAGGFRDFTRIASSHPVMWHDIMLANKGAVIDVMQSFRSHLDHLEQAIEAHDSEAILAIFTRAKEARDAFSEQLNNRQSGNDL